MGKLEVVKSIDDIKIKDDKSYVLNYSNLGIEIGKIPKGKGMNYKLKEYVLDRLSKLDSGSKIIIIDPENEWNEINKVINKV